MTGLRTLAIAVTTTVIATGMVNVAPAFAGTAERGHYVDHYDLTVDACGTPVHISGVTTGHFVGQLRGSDPNAFYVDHFFDSATYTNLDTGRSYSSVNRITHRDTSFAQLDATTIKVSAKESGTFTVYDGEGNIYYRQAGLQMYTAVIDTKGTEDDEDDETVDFEYSTRGHFIENDFCDDVVALTS